MHAGDLLAVLAEAGGGPPVLSGHSLGATTGLLAAAAAPERVRALAFLLHFGGDLCAMGLAIALPVGFSVVLVQLVMGMLARSAPALNLFSVGLPAALLAGRVLLAIATPMMADTIARALMRGIDLSRALARG